VKTAYSAEDLYENFLSEIGCVRGITHRARQQGVYGMMVARNQPGKRLVRASSELFDESRFIRLERESSDVTGSGKIRSGKIAHGEVRLQFRILPRYRISGVACMYAQTHEK
jgi:hypothetical protein